MRLRGGARSPARSCASASAARHAHVVRGSPPTARSSHATARRPDRSSRSDKPAMRVAARREVRVVRRRGAPYSISAVPRRRRDGSASRRPTRRAGSADGFDRVARGRLLERPLGGFESVRPAAARGRTASGRRSWRPGSTPTPSERFERLAEVDAVARAPARVQPDLARARGRRAAGPGCARARCRASAPPARRGRRAPAPGRARPAARRASRSRPAMHLQLLELVARADRVAPYRSASSSRAGMSPGDSATAFRTRAAPRRSGRRSRRHSPQQVVRVGGAGRPARASASSAVSAASMSPLR